MFSSRLLCQNSHAGYEIRYKIGSLACRVGTRGVACKVCTSPPSEASDDADGRQEELTEKKKKADLIERIIPHRRHKECRKELKKLKEKSEPLKQVCVA